MSSGSYLPFSFYITDHTHTHAHTQTHTHTHTHTRTHTHTQLKRFWKLNLTSFKTINLRLKCINRVGVLINNPPAIQFPYKLEFILCKNWGPL